MTEPRPVPADDVGDVPLSVLGVRVELPEQHHVILLVDPPGRIMVPLWVGAPEAAAAGPWDDLLDMPETSPFLGDGP